MIKIISSPNCVNSPKIEFLKQYNIAFAEGNLTFLIDSVSDDIVWNIIGDQQIEGKVNFAKAMEEMKSVKASELIIDQILSHGKEGAANGMMKMQNGEKYAFSDFYMFQAAKEVKIKAITSYYIKM
tara:strand:- start:335 stop:712 length:378 start_codon:yes stop_codon:yes gene_type:complete